MDGGGADVPAAPVAATGLLLLALPVLVTALHVTIVRDLGEGRAPTVSEALRSAAPRFPHAIAALVVYSLLAFGGTLLLVIPGIWVLVAGYFVAQVAVLERRGPLAAFRRSTELVQDRWWRTAGTLALGGVLLAIPTYPAGLAIDTVDSGALYVVLYTLLQVLTLSLTALFGTLLYFSLRAQKGQPFRSAAIRGYLPPTPATQPPADM